MSTASLWPSFVSDKVAHPLRILKQQADALTENSGGRLCGIVRQKDTPDDGESEKIVVVFEASAPEIEYTQPLFEATWDDALPYPVHLKGSGRIFKSELGAISQSHADCFSPSNLEDQLHNAFHSPQISALISSLLSRLPE